MLYTEELVRTECGICIIMCRQGEYRLSIANIIMIDD